MRIKNGCIVIIAVGLLLCTSPFGRAKGEDLESNGPDEGEKVESIILIESELSNYFPIDTGTTWVYEIEIGEAEPHFYREEKWPVGDDEYVTYETRGLRTFLDNTSRKTFTLKIKVKGHAEKQGAFEFPLGVELDIEKDELGIFEDTKQVFWAITDNPTFRVIELVTYPPDMLGAPTSPWGSWKQDDTFSTRMLFFSDAPGTVTWLGDENKDYLLFTGVDTEIPANEEENVLHFVRIVGSTENEFGFGEDYVFKGFSEDMWFARGKGLVRLEQKVDGEVSMTWTLVEFSKGDQ